MFRSHRLAGEPVQLQNGDILEFGCMDGKKKDCKRTPEPSSAMAAWSHLSAARAQASARTTTTSSSRAASP